MHLSFNQLTLRYDRRRVAGCIALDWMKAEPEWSRETLWPQDLGFLVVSGLGRQGVLACFRQSRLIGLQCAADGAGQFFPIWLYAEWLGRESFAQFRP